MCASITRILTKSSTFPPCGCINYVRAIQPIFVNAVCSATTKSIIILTRVMQVCYVSVLVLVTSTRRQFEDASRVHERWPNFEGIPLYLQNTIYFHPQNIVQNNEICFSIMAKCTSRLPSLKASRLLQVKDAFEVASCNE